MNILNRHIDRTQLLLAFFVWLGSLIVYLLTMQPTLSFWDCGEFIAVSAILGIPHPPGTPLYVLIGHLFTLIAPFSDIAVRVNFLSGLSSAFASMFAYLLGVRVLRIALPGNGQSSYRQVLIHAGSVCGALMMTFALTQWTNSVEAEVYGLAILMVMALMWLTTIYIELPDTAKASRLMILIVYIAALGIGVHMTTFLALPIAALFFVFRKDMSRGAWYLVGAAFLFEFFLIFALSSRPDEIPFYIPVLIVAIIFAFYTFSFDQIPRRLLLFNAGFLVALIPFFNALYLVTRGGSAADVPTAVMGIGAAGLIATVGYGLYCLTQYSKQRKTGAEPDSQLLYPAVFTLVALLMVIITVLDIRGYEAFLGLSALVIFAVAIALRNQIRLLNLIAIGSVLLIVIGVKVFFLGMAIAAVLIPIIGILRKDGQWKTALMIVVAGFIGFMVHLYIPIRSAESPYIDQNNPSQSLQATINFIERKQYGSQSMVERMFERRGEWENQLGTHRRMGFWGFFQEQYGLTGPKFFFLFILGVFGLWEVVRRRPRVGMLLLLMLIVSSVGLVLYMNFADGTRMTPAGQDYLEVRDRDYFFTPAFVLFGLLIGLGVSTLLQFVRESIAEFTGGPKRIILAAAPILFLLPVYPLAHNWYYCDRSEDYIPFNYGWNLLQSADPNAVLFTSGDNDTFPLWCLQEAYRIRKDVRVVNLSLANTDWYNIQVQETMGLNLGMTEEQIKDLRPFRTRDGLTFRISNQISDAIIQNNYPETPINFSVTVSPSQRSFRGRPVDNQLELSGMKWRLTSSGMGMRVNVDESESFFTNDSLFRLGGIGDPSIYKSESTLRVTRNLASSLLMVSDTLRKAGEMERAERLARLASENVPHNDDALRYLGSLLAEQGKVGPLADLVEQTDPPRKTDVAVMWARSFRSIGDNDRANQVLDSLLVQHPHDELVLDELVRLHVSQQQWQELAIVLQLWLQNNPGHERATQTLRALEQRFRSAPDSGAPTQP